MGIGDGEHKYFSEEHQYLSMIMDVITYQRDSSIYQETSSTYGGVRTYSKYLLYQGIQFLTRGPQLQYLSGDILYKYLLGE